MNSPEGFTNVAHDALAHDANRHWDPHGTAGVPEGAA